MILVWADTHFNHKGILKHCERPYANVEEMNRDLIRRWNAGVCPSDTIYFLGDFGFASKEFPLADIFAALDGHKHLVIGNHDEQNPAVLKLPWVSQRDVVTLREDGVRAVACHYPMETWKGAHHGYLMLHGHSHGTLQRHLPHRFDMGVEEWPCPWPLRELAKLAEKQTFQPTDHHGQESEDDR